MPAKKKIKKTNSNALLISEPDLHAINQARTVREELDISQGIVDVETEINIGSVSKIENPRSLHKYNFGQLNILAKYYSQKVTKEKQPGNQNSQYKEESGISIHDFLPVIPLLAQNKVQKVIAESVKPAGVEEAVSTLIESGFFDHEYVSSHAVHENAEKIVQKKLLIESVRTRLYILFLQKVLDRKKMGLDNTYHYKKL